MAASSDFNYADLLTLEKARARRKGRLNYLGSKELIIEYPRITELTKEECVEWLEDNRLTLSNPEINGKTHTGSWTCVDISYAESKNSNTGFSIIQRFKVDSALGGYPSTAGDAATLSLTEESERTYFWRVVDPDSVNLPESTTEGVTYVKSATENSDGTYDVTIIKTTAIANTVSQFYTKRSVMDYQYTTLYYRTDDPDAVTVPAPTAGNIYEKTVSENSDGTYNVALRQNVATNTSVSNLPTLSSSGGSAVTSYSWNATDPSATLPVGVPSAGTVYRKQIFKNNDGTYNIVLTRDSSSEVVGITTREDQLATITNTVTINDSAIDYDTALAAYLSAAGDSAFYIELCLDPAFNDATDWDDNSSSATISSNTASFDSSEFVMTDDTPLEAGKYYRVKYTIDTADAGAKSLAFGCSNSHASNVEIPSTVGTHYIIAQPPNIGSGNIAITADSGLTNEIVMSGLYVSEWYGAVTGNESSDPQVISATTLPPGLVFEIQNIPQENGKYRTTQTADVAKVNIRSVTYMSTSGAGPVSRTQIDVRNGTPAFVSAQVYAFEYNNLDSARPSYAINKYGLLDMTLIAYT